MRWNAFKILALTVILQSLAVMSAYARIRYEWDDGKLHGWQHVKSSSEKAGYYDLSFTPVAHEHECHADKGTFFMGQNQENDDRPMDWAKWPQPGSGAHQTVWIESPAFKLDGSGPLTYYGAGLDGPVNPATGERNMSLVGMTIPDIGGTWGAESKNDPSTTGAIAVGLRDVATGQFVLSKNFQGGYIFKLYSFTKEELAPFAKNGRAYTLNVVDALCGASSWCAIDRVTIPGKLLVPEPVSYSTIAWEVGGVVLGVGLILMWRKRKKTPKLSKRQQPDYSQEVAVNHVDSNNLPEEKQTSNQWLGWACLVYLYAVTTACLVVAFLMFYATDSTDPWLVRKDGVFGIRNVNLLWWVGSGYLLLSVFILVSLVKERFVNGLMGTLWMGLNSLVYAWGMSWAAQEATSKTQKYFSDPFPIVILTGRQAGIDPRIFKTCWKAFIGYLIVGSVLLILTSMVIGWRRRKLEKDAAWWDAWREKRKYSDK